MNSTLDYCNSMDTNSSDQNKVLSTTLAVTSLVSALGCLSLIFGIVWESRLFSLSTFRAIVLSMAISDLGLSLTFFVCALEPCGFAPWSCTLIGATLQFFSWASLCWSLNLAIYLHTITVAQSVLVRSTWRMPIMHAYSWSSSIGVTLAFHFGLDAYGFAGNFCWIKSSLSYLWLPAYYIPLIAILLYTVGVFAYTMWRLREGRKIGSVREDTPDRLLAHSQRRLSLFAVIFFVYALANLAKITIRTSK